MNFPDSNSLLQLQEFFQEWPNCRASVMVGAGFSLNSKPKPGTQTRFPTWNELAWAMFDEIYPKSSNATGDQEGERVQRFYQSNPLTLASKYEARFGREKLNSFLQKTIPDKDHEPGYLHKLLLQLPWRDVFTTNYDTLLERTDVSEKSYGLVETISDVQTARIPRIFKLHGSFHSKTSFIITEEDYRTYPQHFALFVNTVRQSLAENAFVLVGFSGNDPNFLNWTGWIRDNLGDRHNPIFLVGSLSLTTENRLLLTSRGVTPIDLSPVFAGETPADGIHSVAIEWFFSGLLELKPHRPGRWPNSNRRTITNVEPPVSANGETEPETVESLVGSQNTFDETTAIKAIARWRYEREQYPGWLVPPDELRSSLWRKTMPHIGNLIKATRNWSYVDQTLLFREILWRVETSMLPLDNSLVDPFKTAVDGLFSLLRNNSRLRPSHKVTRLLGVSDTEVSESWLEIAFALLRDARESHDAERWDLLKDEISQVIHHYPQHHDRYCYEQALWLLWNLERDQARNLIESWSPSCHSPLSMMWKAGLLIELDNWEESRSLLQTALQEIRTPPFETQSLYIDRLSLEGWCTYLLMPIESFINLYSRIQDPQEQEDNISPDELREKFLERWDVLRSLDCDPWMHTEHFDKVLTEKPPVPQKTQEIVPGFDLDHYSIRHSIIDESNTKWLPAFSYLRMHEQVGIPPHYLSGTLRNAAEWLSLFANYWSPMLVIRAGNIRAFQESDFMSRTRIASIDSDLAHSLNKWAISVLKREPFSPPAPTLMQSIQEQLLESLIEFLSRLTLKLKPLDLQEAFYIALAFHNRTVIKTHIRLNKSCGPWFKRLFEAADEQQLLAWLPDLIRFPLPEEAKEDERPQHPAISWPDPMTEFPVDPVRDIQEIDSNLRAEIHEAIQGLLHNTQATSGETRQRAMARLFFVFHTSLMTQEQEEHFADLLWENTAETGLPDLPNLTFFNFLHLPSPHEIDAKSRLKQHFLTLKPRKSVSLDGPSVSISLPGEREDQMIHEVSSASKPVIRLPSDLRGKIQWNLTEVRQMWKDVYEWWENDKHVIKQTNNDPNFAAGFDGYARQSLERISMFLARVVLPKMETANEDEWTTILSFLSETRQDKVFLTPTLPYILLHRPSEYDMVMKTIRDDLSSDDEKAVEAAAEAVSHWAYLGDETNVEHVPSDVFNDLIKRVVFRRREGVKTCLKQLTLILNKKRDLFSPDQVHLIVSSLTSWHQATRIPIPENDSGGFPEHEKPLLRALLGQLASALSTWLKIKLPDQPEPPDISTLRELYSSDPLPEVRRSFDNI